MSFILIALLGAFSITQIVTLLIIQSEFDTLVQLALTFYNESAELTPIGWIVLIIGLVLLGLTVYLAWFKNVFGYVAGIASGIILGELFYITNIVAVLA